MSRKVTADRLYPHLCVFLLGVFIVLEVCNDNTLSLKDPLWSVGLFLGASIASLVCSQNRHRIVELLCELPVAYCVVFFFLPGVHPGLTFIAAMAALALLNLLQGKENNLSIKQLYSNYSSEARRLKLILSAAVFVILLVLTGLRHISFSLAALWTLMVIVSFAVFDLILTLPGAIASLWRRSLLATAFAFVTCLVVLGLVWDSYTNLNHIPGYYFIGLWPLILASDLIYSLLLDSLLLDNYSLYSNKHRQIQQNTNNVLAYSNSIASPHFLFNALGSIKLRINRNPDDADNYLDQLTSLLRYVVSKRDNPLSTVEEELTFLDDYISLMRQQYGEGLSLRVHIEDNYKTRLIPSCSLQTLAENAIKHNAIGNTEHDALNIQVFANELGISVKNNHRPIKQNNEGTGYGLSHLTESLEAHGKRLIIDNDESVFSVTIPYIET